MEKIADVFERKTHGASFELYTSFIRHQEHNKKLSDLLIISSHFFAYFFKQKKCYFSILFGWFYRSKIIPK